MSEVVDLKTRQPYALVLTERRNQKRAAARKRAREMSEAKKDHKAACLSLIDDVRKLIEDDKLEGLVIMGRDVKTKAFFNDFVLDVATVSLTDYFAYAGMIDTISDELKECATMAPALLADGSVQDPYLEPDDTEYYEEF